MDQSVFALAQGFFVLDQRVFGPRSSFLGLRFRHTVDMQMYSGSSSLKSCKLVKQLAHVDVHSLYKCQLPCPLRNDCEKRSKSTETGKNERRKYLKVFAYQTNIYTSLERKNYV